MDVLEDIEYNCPYCSESQTIRVDKTGGSHQYFVTDCEVCCSPIAMEVDVDADGYVNLVAKREGEG